MKSLGSEMDGMGENGWELVSVIPYKGNHVLPFFKKPGCIVVPPLL